MRLKVITLDLELTKLQKVIAGVGLAVALTTVAGVAFAGLPHTFAAGQTMKAADLNDNFNAVHVLGASVQNTASFNGATWGTIPGMTVNLTLTQSSLVQLSGAGDQRTVDMAATSICHAGYRYVIDGVPKGEPSWGQHIQVSSGATAWHASWALNDSVTLAPGAHTIELQATLMPTGGANQNCVVCGETGGSADPHDGCTLNAVAIPQ